MYVYIYMTYLPIPRQITYMQHYTSSYCIPIFVDVFFYALLDFSDFVFFLIFHFYLPEGLLSHLRIHQFSLWPLALYYVSLSLLGLIVFHSRYCIPLCLGSSIFAYGLVLSVTLFDYPSTCLVYCISRLCWFSVIACLHNLPEGWLSLGIPHFSLFPLVFVYDLWFVAFWVYCLS